MLGLHQQYSDLSQLPLISSSPPRGSENAQGMVNGSQNHGVSLGPNGAGPTPSSPINLASGTYTFKTESGLMDPGNGVPNVSNGYGGPLPSMVGTAALQAAANANAQQGNNNQQKKEKSKKSNDNGTKKKKTR